MAIAMTRRCGLPRRQVTRDWLIMELEDIRLDDDTFRELTSSGALEQHWRPQVPHFATIICASARPTITRAHARVRCLVPVSDSSSIAI